MCRIKIRISYLTQACVGNYYKMILFLTVIFTSFSGSLSDRVFEVNEFNKCATSDSVFLVVNQVSITQCVSECSSRSDCFAVNYRLRTHQCELIAMTGFAIPTLVPNSTPNNPCVHIRRTSIFLVNTCTCGQHQACDMRNDPPICVNKECAPLSLENGDIQGNQNKIGTRRKFHCNPGYQLTGTQTFTVCLSTGLWEIVPVCTTVAPACASPPSIPNTFSTLGPAADGESRSYTCKPGYSEGDDVHITTTTCSASTWTPSVNITCYILCNDPTTKSNAVWTSTGIFEGSTSTYTCNSGYGTGSSPADMVTTCVATGSWSAVNFVCSQDCGTPLVEPFAVVSPGGVSVTSQRFYTCVPGYSTAATVSDVTTTCLPTGTWSATSFTCTVTQDCGAPPAGDNVIVSSGSSTQGSQRTYSCVSGYTTGNDVVIMTTTCTASLQWSPTIFTCYKDCGSPPDLPNSYISSGDTHEGSTRTHTCDSGYGTGSSPAEMVTTCLSTGTWSVVSFVCSIDCGVPPDMPNSYISSGNTHEGSTRTHTCDSGYGTGSSPADMVTTCLSTGSWSVVTFVCSIDCGVPPAQTNASPSTGSSLETDTRTYTCNSGYSTTSPVTERIVVCQSSGTWSSSSFSCVVDCGMPPAQPDAVTSSGSTLETDQRTYTCNSGYSTTSPVTDRTVVCQSTGSWSSPSFTCVVDCGYPSSQPNTIITTSGSTTVTSSRTYSCNNGYSTTSSTADMTIVCQPSGTWSTPSFTCVVDCGVPPSVQYSSVVAGGTTVGSQRQYACWAGYSTSSVTSEMMTTCLASGSWSATSFTCSQDRTHGQACTSDSDCKEASGQCIDSLCFCGHLYTYDTAIQNCVQKCTTMLNTFTKHDYKTIIGHNDLDFKRVVADISECRLLCRNDPVCLSFEVIYQLDADFAITGYKCSRSSVTWEMIQETKPSAIVYRVDIDIWSRNCN